MFKRILTLAAVVLYLATAVALTIFYFTTEGTFPVSSRLFWAFTALPPLIILAHLAGAAMLLWKWERAAAAVVAVELLFLAFAATGAALYWTTFRWFLLAAFLRGSFAGVIIGYLWGRLEGQRKLAIALGGAAVALGILWPLALLPESPGAQPMIHTTKRPEAVWPKSTGAKDVTGDQLGLDLAGAKVNIHSNPPLVDLVVDGTTIQIAPLMSLREISVDGAWLIAGTRFTPGVNTLGMTLLLPSEATAWSKDSRLYTLLRYSRAELAAATLARQPALAAYGLSALSGDLYVSLDGPAGAIDLVGLTSLSDPAAVHDSEFFTVRLLPYTDQKIVLPVGTQPIAWTGDDIGKKTAVVNLQDGRAVLYGAGSQARPPLVETAQAEAFADYLAIELPKTKQAVLIYFPDWNAQATRQLSPSAGSPLAANALRLAVEPVEVETADGHRSTLSQLQVTAALATAAVGRGSPVVMMNDGTYVNRMCVRLVPAGSDYRKLVAGFKLWQPAK